MRFSGFDDEWNEVKLGDISTFLDNKRIPLKEDDRKQIKGEYPYYGASGIIDYVNDYIFDEELILMGEDGANIVTRSSKLIFLAKGKYWVNNHAHVIKADNNINQYFLSESLERINYEKYNTGTAQPKLNREVCQKIKVKIPQFNEQNKIANFLLVIDEKLRLLEQKYQYYQNFKKYLMQQIFTQKLRFDFDEIKLKSISKINKGKQLNKEHMLEIGKFYVLNGGQEPSGYTDSWNTSENTITISEGGNSCGFVNFNTEKFWSGGHCYYLNKLSENIDVYYLYSYLKFIEPQIMRLRVGSGLPNIQKGDIENIKIKILPKKEQIKISNLLLSTDNKISSIESQKDSFEIFKKGLLQQMFVVRINWRCNFKLAKSPSFNKHLLILKNKIIFIIIE